jgi:hypothetical protein
MSALVAVNQARSRRLDIAMGPSAACLVDQRVIRHDLDHSNHVGVLLARPDVGS